MPLLEPLPEQVEKALVSAEDGASQHRIAFATDISSDGSFGQEWLVVTSENLYVFSPNGGTKAEVRHSLPISQIKDAKAEMLVGNGILEVRTEREVVPVLRYTHTVAGEVSAAARQLASLAKGEEPKPAEVEEKKRCKSCGRYLPPDTSVCPKCINKRAVMLRLFRFLAPYKLQVVSVAVVLVLTTLLEIFPPRIGGAIVDTLVKGAQATLPSQQSHAFGLLMWFVCILAAMRVGGAVLTYAQRRLSPWIGARTLMDIRVALYHKFNELSLSYYDKRSVGSVMARVTNDADNLWDFLSDGIPWFLTNTLILVGIGYNLFAMNWQLALLLMTPGPLIFALTRWFMPRARRRWHNVWHRISKMYSSLSSTINGMRVIKAFAQEDKENRRFTERNRMVFEASYAANAMWAVYFPLMGLLMFMGQFIVWIAGGHKVLGHEMSIGTLTAFNAYLWMFYGPFQNLSRVMDWSTRSLTAAERVFEVLDTEPEVKEADQPVDLPQIEGAVEFQDVTFGYDKSKHVLEDFTLKVEPGEMIGLVGHSGAGKSTIINLLSRFYDVNQGTILVDGVDIRRIQRHDFRRQLGIVLQEPFLFPGTIRDNIAYAKPDATPEEIMRAAKAANCHEFILKFPDGYDTQVGERGQRLSGGERQRISIARAILADPRILILDEATASVDTETEKQIQEAIARLIQNRTTFAIAHRLSTLRNADRLVVMKEGKMVECGTHDELMDLDGVYAGLVKVQTEINKIRAV